MPQNPFVVATKSPSAEVFIFDISKHPSTPKEKMGFCPDRVCYGHAREGYGLCWNPHAGGSLLSGSDDACICLWDIHTGTKQVHTICRWKGHVDVVEDVAWHSQSPHVFASVGDDRKLLVWDVRKAKTIDPTIEVTYAHDGDVNSVSFNPLHEFLLATGSADNLVNLWDLRNTSCPVHMLMGHENEVFQVQWAPFNSSVIATCGADRRVRVWDISMIGANVHQCGIGPPELLFIHGGHTSTVSELSWNCKDSWTAVSVSEDNMLHIWKLVRRMSCNVLSWSSGENTSTQCLLAPRIGSNQIRFGSIEPCVLPHSIEMSVLTTPRLESFD